MRLGLFRRRFKDKMPFERPHFCYLESTKMVISCLIIQIEAPSEGSDIAPRPLVMLPNQSATWLTRGLWLEIGLTRNSLQDSSVVAPQMRRRTPAMEMLPSDEATSSQVFLQLCGLILGGFFLCVFIELTVRVLIKDRGCI
jgi:hypothetical protein